uniref:Uncharacterized protein n=1 Tax=Anopheles minimus TaxID=112268 RepID=A0A182WPX1_9DIPT
MNYSLPDAVGALTLATNLPANPAENREKIYASITPPFDHQYRQKLKHTILNMALPVAVINLMRNMRCDLGLLLEIIRNIWCCMLLTLNRTNTAEMCIQCCITLNVYFRYTKRT